MKIYTVRSGDSLYAIARKYAVSVDTLVYANQIADPARLALGQALVIPVTEVRHTVRRGQTLGGIALEYGVTVAALMAANPAITNPNAVQAGQTVTVPFPDQNLGELTANGYAYPQLSEEVLSQYAPYLTFLSPFSYMTDESGAMTPISDEALIENAREQGVAALMTITNLRASGGFSSDIAHAILTDETAQNNFIQNMLTTAENKGYYGVNIDFEYVYGFDRDSLSQFIRRLADILHARGKILTTALAPKLSADQAGLLYAAHDYAAQGEAADYIILMTYEWGYTYGPAMAVAPANMVRRVLSYATDVINPGKILMGLPNYGYDWTLPFVQGTAARSISNPGAVELAVEMNAAIRFDEPAQSPFFHYFGSDGRRHEVWFEDARSIRSKLLLVSEFGLAGISWWTVNRLFRQALFVQQSMFSTEKVI